MVDNQCDHKTTTKKNIMGNGSALSLVCEDCGSVLQWILPENKPANGQRLRDD